MFTFRLFLVGAVFFVLGCASPQNLILVDQNVTGISGLAATGNPFLTGDINISAGTNISLDQNGNVITITSTATGGGFSDVNYWSNTALWVPVGDANISSGARWNADLNWNDIAGIFPIADSNLALKYQTGSCDSNANCNITGTIGGASDANGVGRLDVRVLKDGNTWVQQLAGSGGSGISYSQFQTVFDSNIAARVPWQDANVSDNLTIRSSSDANFYNGLTSNRVFSVDNNTLTFGTNKVARMTINTTGNVGIGKLSPASNYALDVNTNVYAAQFVISNDDTSWRGVRFGWQNADGSSPFGITIGGYNAAGNKLIRIEPDGSPTTLLFDIAPQFTTQITTPLGIIGANHTDLSITLATNSLGGYKGIKFKTQDGVNTRMFVGEDGNVGIGTVTPPTQLQVAGTTAVGKSIIAGIGGSSTGFAGTNDINAISLLAFSGADYNAGFGISHGAMIGMAKENSWNSSTPKGALVMYTSNGGSFAEPNSTEKMRITSDGNVGIGTSTPAYKLDINSGGAPIAIYVDTNISAGGYVTHTEAYDKTKGSALTQIKDANEYLTGGKADDTKFGYSTVTYPKTIFEGYEDVNELKIIDENGTKAIVTTKRPIYSTTIETGVSIDKELALLKQALYEMKTCIKTSKTFEDVQGCVG